MLCQIAATTQFSAALFSNLGPSVLKWGKKKSRYPAAGGATCQPTFCLLSLACERVCGLGIKYRLHTKGEVSHLFYRVPLAQGE